MPFVCSSQRLSSIFNEYRAMFVTNGTNLIHFSGCTIQMYQHHHLDLRIQLKSLLQGHWIHIPGVALGVDKYRLTTLVHHWVDRSAKSHIRAKHLITGLHTRQLHTQVESCCTRREGHSIFAPYLLTSDALNFINVFPHRRHPIALICFCYVAQLFSVHRGSREPHFFLKRLHDLQRSF